MPILLESSAAVFRQSLHRLRQMQPDLRVDQGIATGNSADPFLPRLGIDPCQPTITRWMGLSRSMLTPAAFRNWGAVRVPNIWEKQMSRSLGNIIADSLDLCLGYGDRLLKDVTADQFARLAAPQGTPVDSNHPAFIYGHLAIYTPRILRDLGLEAAEMPEGFEAVFSKDAKCEDDAAGTVYPSMDEVMRVFREGYQAASAALRAADDEAFQVPNPNPGRLAELFPSLGSMHAFYCGGHMMMHLGQMSAWRRMAGLGAA